MGLLKLLAARRAKAQIEDCVRIIRISTFVYLMVKYEAKCDKETAAGLAAAVANALFGSEPSNQVGREFLAAIEDINRRTTIVDLLLEAGARRGGELQATEVGT